MTFWSVTPSVNLPSIKELGLIPKIGVRSALQGETEPAVYMFTNKEDLEDALVNWLGEELEDEPITMMKITLPTSYEPFLKRVAFEVQCRKTIPADWIEFLE